MSLLNFCKELPSDYEITFILLKKGSICIEFEKSGYPYKIIPFELWVYYYWESRNLIYSIVRKIIWFSQGIYKVLKKLLLVGSVPEGISTDTLCRLDGFDSPAELTATTR